MSVYGKKHLSEAANGLGIEIAGTAQENVHSTSAFVEKVNLFGASSGSAGSQKIEIYVDSVKAGESTITTNEGIKPIFPAPLTLPSGSTVTAKLSANSATQTFVIFGHSDYQLTEPSSGYKVLTINSGDPVSANTTPNLIHSTTTDITNLDELHIYASSASAEQVIVTINDTDEIKKDLPGGTTEAVVDGITIRAVDANTASTVKVSTAGANAVSVFGHVNRIY